MNRSFIMLLVLVIFLGAGFGGSFVGGVIYGQNQAKNAEGELSPSLGVAGQFPGGGQGGNAGQRGQGRQGQGGGAAAAQGQRGGFAGGQGQGGLAASRPGGGPGGAAGAPGGRGLGQFAAAAQVQGNAIGEGQAPGTTGAPEARAAGQEQGNSPVQERAAPGRDGRGDAPVAAEANEGVDAAGSSHASASTEAAQQAEVVNPGFGNRGGAVGTVQGLEGDVLTVTSPRGDLAVMLSESTRVFQVSETGRESLAAETRIRVLGTRNAEGGIAAQSVLIVPEGVESLFGAAGGPGGRTRGQGP